MTELWPFQLDGAEAIHFDFDGRALLADEMGLGKTIQALYYVYKKRKCRPVIVVCPASLKYNWEHEAKHHMNLMSEVLEGRRPPKRKKFTSCPILIINYDILRWWLPFLVALNPQVVIIDEVHYIKNRLSKRFKAVKALCAGVPHVIGISGTPLTNRPAELWPILSILRPDKFDSFFKYVFRYCKPRKLPWGWVYDGAKNLGELHGYLRDWCMIRRLKKDVLPDLPAKIRQVIPLRLPDRREYDEASTDFIGWLEKQSLEKARRALQAESLVRIGYLLRLCAKLKVPLIKDWIDNYLDSTDQKLVVFTMHKPMVQSLARRYHDECVVIDGDVKVRDRQGLVHQFQKDPNIRVFIGNVKAAGVGLTLTSASTCVFTDLPWTPGDLGQGEDRIHRIGQLKAARIIYLVAIATLEERLCEILRDKQSILNDVLDGDDRHSDDLNIFNELLKSASKPLLT